jgi:DNA-binding transcriptional MerR regulator
MTAVLSAPVVDPLSTLREYRGLAPWGLRDLTALAAGILDASGVVPVSAVARSRPTERTIRFYVARHLVNPPDGRGTAATYGYRHLLQVLAVKLRQMEGATLETIERDLTGVTGDAVERRVAATLGPRLPRPADLQLLRGPGTARGRVARAVDAWLAPPSDEAARSSVCRRVAIGPGIELLVDEAHPVLQLGGDTGLAARVRAAIEEAVRAALR